MSRTLIPPAMVSSRFLSLTIAPVAIVILSGWITQCVRAPLEPTWEPNSVESIRPPARGETAGMLAHWSSLEAPCRRQADHLQKLLGPECEVIVRPPFVIGGDLPQAELERWYAWTIEPATRALWGSLMDSTPNQPIRLLLFQQTASYQRYCESVVGDPPISVYGYYKPEHHTAIVNLATGTGSLVHELTHALMQFDFPAAPLWFQEGLASLHEQAGYERQGGERVLRGRTNWRLRVLQQSRAKAELPPLSNLLEPGEFRGNDEDLHYAQARYLCLYLQEQGRLDEFYARLQHNQASDPTGQETLPQVLGKRSLEEVNRDFERWLWELEPCDR